MPTSTTRALDVPEILEAILLELDIRSVITSAQRVNHYWHDLIKRSPSIQQALFFEPAPAVAGQQPVRNPLLAKIFPLHVHPPKDDWLADEQDYVLTKPQLAPVFMRKGASWARMLVRQPPILKLAVMRETLGDKAKIGDYWQHMRSYPKTMRIKELYDLVSTHARRIVSTPSSWSFCDFRDSHAQEILKRIDARGLYITSYERNMLCVLANATDIVFVVQEQTDY